MAEATTSLAAPAVVVEAYPPFQLELAHLQYNRGNAVQAREHLNVALTAWKYAAPEFPPAQEARQLAALLDTP